jgi:glycosyltransferase involved in cell wall biosynthesis
LWTHRSRCQVIHFHYIQQFYAYEEMYARLRWVIRFARNLLAARAMGYRTIFTLHNLHPTQELQPAWTDRLGHWAAANLTDRIIVHCQAAKKALSETYGRQREVYVIPHPNYIDAYPNQISRPEALLRLGLTEEDFVFLFIGGIRPNKGVEALITAFQNLQEDHLKLIIAGKSSGPDEYLTGLQRTASSDLRIRLADQFIPDEELQIYLNACNVVVLPFARILTSGSLILALSFGRPVVAPAIGCLPETLSTESGILYEPGNSKDLERALRDCLSLNLAEMGAAGRRSMQKATWAGMAIETRKVYLS